MRLAIDLQACQQGAANSNDTVALVRAVVAAAQAAGHAVLLLLHHAWPEQADTLRRELALPWQPFSAADAPGQV